MNTRTSLIALGVVAAALLLLSAIFGRGFVRPLLYAGIIIGLISVVVSLFAGLGMMTFGAATQEKGAQMRWTSLLMRSRVFAQGMTILCGTLLLMSNGSE